MAGSLSTWWFEILFSPNGSAFSIYELWNNRRLLKMEPSAGVHERMNLIGDREMTTLLSH